MTGMDTMSLAVSPLADDEGFRSMFTWFSHPIPGMLAGAILTAIIQSSSASIGILQALCTAGAVSYGAAIPIILGQNIGTCVTALLSSIGAGKNAKRASMIHLYFNLIGTFLFMTVFYAINAIRPFSFLMDSAQPVGIAVIHTLFNVGCAMILYPFGNLLIKLAVLSVSDKNGKSASEK
jgi:phosphate:Na+ symporter